MYITDQDKYWLWGFVHNKFRWGGCFTREMGGDFG